MTVKMYLLIFAICLAGFAVQPSFADQAQMNETLTRINRLLSQINPLINLAEMQQDNDTRVKFQFKILRQDITHVQFGIDQALHRVTIQPRVVESLRGDYLPISPSSLKSLDSGNNNTLLRSEYPVGLPRALLAESLKTTRVFNFIKAGRSRSEKFP